MGDIGIASAFIAGLASFLSPCILPLIPGYLSYISGSSIDEMIHAGAMKTWHIFLRTFFFVLGFSIIFILMGAAATFLGQFISKKLFFFYKVAGLVIIFFGLHLLGVFRFRFLMADKRYQGRIFGGYLGAVVLGMALAFGWSPCAGPILFSILAYASTQETVWRGIALLASYSFGFGVPLLIVGTGVGTFIKVFDRFKRYLRWIEIAGGLLLLVIGTLLLTGNASKMAALIPQDWLLSR